MRAEWAAVRHWVCDPGTMMMMMMMMTMIDHDDDDGDDDDGGDDDDNNGDCGGVVEDNAVITCHRTHSETCASQAHTTWPLMHM